MKFKHLATLVCGVMLAVTGAQAGESGSFYLAAGTGGAGVGYAIPLTNEVSLRAQYNNYDQGFSGSLGDFGGAADLKARVRLETIQLLADYYPSNSGLRLTGGMVVNNSYIKMDATGATVGNATNQTVNAVLSFSESISPYVGVGFSIKPKLAKGFGFVFDLGVMSQNPKVSISASNASQADLDAQSVKMLDALNGLRVLPVLSMGVSYSF